MSHVVRLNQLDAWSADKVTRCDHCNRRNDGTVVLCGWHENTVAAFKYVEHVAGRSRSAPPRTENP